MSSARETSTIHDPLKFWKFVVLPTIKPSDLFSLFLKSTLTLCFLASIPLFLFFAFSHTHSHFCPKYHNKLDDHYQNPPISTNISHILFGIGSSAKSWNKRRHYSELWWKPNVTRGFVWLDETPKTPWPTTSPPYKISANTSRFKYSCWYGSRSAIRIARIVKESFELGMENVRWFVMGDDDTAFFTENLVSVLGKYDHEEMYYIGGNSESVEQDVIHSYDMAYGGGGFAISYPLAAELVRVLDACIARYEGFYGSDQKVQGCLTEIGVPLTKHIGFHQFDIRGDPYGLLAAHPLAPLVSLHHLDYVRPLFPNLTRIDSLHKLMSAYEADPGRTLQRSFCYDLRRNWTVSVSWGYTVQLYPSFVTIKKLDAALLTFKSWRTWRKEPFTFDTRPVSPDPCERPIVYFLDRVEKNSEGETLSTYKRYQEKNSEGETLSTYKRYQEKSKKECERVGYGNAVAVQSFKVSATKFNPNLWNKAPRRQCCQIINAEQNAVLQLHIRPCNRFESSMPIQN